MRAFGVRPTGSLLRPRDGHGQRVTFVELFFDLVYVFAVTQLSHRLLEHLTFGGAGETLLLLLAVWWAWIYTTWFSNWFDPDRTPVRILLVGVMLASLVMSATLPEAFGDRGLAFAVAYVVIQCGRVTFVLVFLEREHDLMPGFRRIMAWAAAAGVFWIAGGVAHGDARIGWWLAALAVDYSAPLVRYATPGLGRSSTSEWTIDGEHFAERCQLFVLVALGESLLTIGRTLSDLHLTALIITSALTAFVGSVGLWWIYFDHDAAESGQALAAASDPGRIGRSAYTYLHLLMIAGIIITAVGDEIALSHPDHHADAGSIATNLGGPALYLLGNALFLWAVFRRRVASRLWAIVGLGVVAAVAAAVELPNLLLCAAGAVAAVAVAVADQLKRRRGRAAARAAATEVGGTVDGDPGTLVGTPRPRG